MRQKGNVIGMDYKQLMEFLSDCGLGAVLLGTDSVICYANSMADRLLHGQGELVGLKLEEIAQSVCEKNMGRYSNIALAEYLARCPADSPSDLPANTELVVFRDATSEAIRDMLQMVVNQIDEGVVMCDAEGRGCFINDAATRLDSLIVQDVRGQGLEEIYSMMDGTEMALPRVIRDRKPLLNLRQRYSTCHGKQLDIVSNNYPVLQNGQILGAFNLVRDLSAVEALHEKVIDLQDKLLSKSGSNTTKEKAKSSLTARYHFNDIYYRSNAMRKIVTKCYQVAKTDASIMLYGETGTGKEVFAQSIHNASRRADGPFLAINCAAIPENLLESLLFGTEKGAYTGALRRAGIFEQANGGTLLLDELNSMNLNLQSKLLRVLQEGVLCRVGGSTQIHVDVRVLSNMNVPPMQAIEEHKLRRDLFYRLGTVNITIPPLRERTEDIPLLVKNFIMQYNQQLGRNVKWIDNSALECFYAYKWPGNVRELQHAVEHAMIVLPDSLSTITPRDLPDYIRGDYDEPAEDSLEALPLQEAVSAYERQYIHRILSEYNGNITRTAQALQISRQSLQYYIKRHGIELPLRQRKGKQQQSGE